MTVADCNGAELGERELACTLEGGVGDLLQWRLALAGAPGAVRDPDHLQR